MCTEQSTLNESSFYSEHEWKLPVFHGIPIKKLCNKHKNWAYMPKKPNEKQYSRSFLKKHRLFLQTLDFFCSSMKNIFDMSLNKIFTILNIFYMSLNRFRQSMKVEYSKNKYIFGESMDCTSFSGFCRWYVK